MKDEELRNRIKQSDRLSKLAGGHQRVNTAPGGELLKGLIGALKSLEGSDEQQALDFLNKELNKNIELDSSGGGVRADNTSDKLAEQIDSLKPDSQSDYASTADGSIDYTVNLNGELVVTMAPPGEIKQHESDDPGQASRGPGFS